MYTVKELIEALKQCPQDYPVFINLGIEVYNIETVGIDNNEQTVDLFPEM